MVNSRNMQLRLQEYTDCFAETDPAAGLREISTKGVEGDATRDLTETALKYLSLALLSAIEENATGIRLTSATEMNGSCFLLGARETRLARPPSGLVKEMIGIVRSITGLEQERGSSSFSWGLREDRLELTARAAKSGSEEVLDLDFPTARGKSGNQGQAKPGRRKPS